MPEVSQVFKLPMQYISFMHVANMCLKPLDNIYCWIFMKLLPNRTNYIICKLSNYGLISRNKFFRVYLKEVQYVHFVCFM